VVFSDSSNIRGKSGITLDIATKGKPTFASAQFVRILFVIYPFARIMDF